MEKKETKNTRTKTSKTTTKTQRSKAKKPARKKVTSQKSASQAKEPEDKKVQKDFWEEAGENISEGARFVGETVTEYAQTLGKTAKEAFKSGSELTMEMVHNAQEIIDNYKDKLEIKRLSDDRDELFAQLGKHLYLKVKSVEEGQPVNYVDDANVQPLLQKIEDIDKKIIELDKQENK